ncbi:Serine/arginine-rich SC35-like splicing factor SCL30A-like protein [Drosera capensis]
MRERPAFAHPNSHQQPDPIGRYHITSSSTGSESSRRAGTRETPLRRLDTVSSPRKMRGRSYTPSPPRGRRGRSPSPRGRYGGGGGRSRDAPTNDLRRPFGQFGKLKDIYLPRDYYSGQPRGFGFVQYVDPSDAGEAKYQMNGQLFQGRELTVVFAEENRKKPADMRARDRGSRRNYDRRRSPARYSRSPRDSRSPPPRYDRSRSRSHDYHSPSPRKKHYSRYPSPEVRKNGRERSGSPRSRGRSYSRSPPYKNSRSRSPSQSRGGSPRNHIREPSEDRSPSQWVPTLVGAGVSQPIQQRTDTLDLEQRRWQQQLRRRRREVVAIDDVGVGVGETDSEEDGIAENVSSGRLLRRTHRRQSLPLDRHRDRHSSVDPHGKVNLEILKDGWSSTLTISKVLLVIRSLLCSPDPYSALAPAIVHLHFVDRTKHDAVAAEWTLRAQREIRSKYSRRVEEGKAIHISWKQQKHHSPFRHSIHRHHRRRAQENGIIAPPGDGVFDFIAAAFHLEPEKQHPVVCIIDENGDFILQRLPSVSYQGEAMALEEVHTSEIRQVEIGRLRPIMQNCQNGGGYLTFVISICVSRESNPDLLLGRQLS